MTDRHWKGGSGLLSDASFWVDGLPSNADDGFIGSATDTAPFTIMGPYDIGELTIGGGDVTLTGSLIAEGLETGQYSGDWAGVVVQGGGKFTVAQGASVTLYPGIGAYALVDLTGVFGVGVGTSGSAVIYGSLNTKNSYIGWTAPGDATISGPNAVWNVGGVYGSTLWVGVQDRGALTVENGATVTTTFLSLDAVAAAKGPSVAVITGVGTTVTVAQSVELNGRGTTLGVFDGATLTGANLTLMAGTTLALDTSATANFDGGVVLDGGSVRLGAAPGQTGNYTETVSTGLALDYNDYDTSYHNTIGTDPNVTLRLTGSIVGGFGYAGGPLVISSGDVVLAGANNTYSITAVFNNFVETGRTEIQNATLELAAPGAAGPGEIRFDNGYNSTLVIDAGALPANAITGFDAGDRLLFQGITFDTVAYSGTNLTLLTGGATGTAVGTLDVGVGYAQGAFAVRQVAGGPELIVPCFAAGTLIATPEGDVAVEAIAAGGDVLTHDGRVARVVWTGHRRVDCVRHPDPRKVWPVLIPAHCLGPNQPRRDLYVSPEHAILADGVLIPALALAGHGAVRQMTVNTIDYHHVELTAHDIILAEDLPAESYLDNGYRGSLGGRGRIAEPPGIVARCWEAAGCAVRVVAGPTLERVRARLALTVRRTA